jgi:predicted short-subunit dehydrogenase-like oxidoreductase (DUF2520 family)
VVHEQSRSQGALALVGPGRAGTTVAAALAARGWSPVAVAGRHPASSATLRVAELLGAPVVEVADAGRNADLVVVATPDAAIADTAAALAPGLRPGSLVIHLSGACPLEELDKLHAARPDVELGSLHPLQSLPSIELGIARLPGCWCAVDGPPRVERLAVSLGMRPFRLDASQRGRYHAAATIASNHLVALLGQAIRVADAAGVPPEALLPLVRSTIDNVGALGSHDALTGPVARGDADTVARHLDALPPEELSTYRALAAEALRLSGRDDAALRDLLGDGS